MEGVVTGDGMAVIHEGHGGMYEMIGRRGIQYSYKNPKNSI